MSAPFVLCGPFEPFPGPFPALFSLFWPFGAILRPFPAHLGPFRPLSVLVLSALLGLFRDFPALCGSLWLFPSPRPSSALLSRSLGNCKIQVPAEQQPPGSAASWMAQFRLWNAADSDGAPGSLPGQWQGDVDACPDDLLYAVRSILENIKRSTFWPKRPLVQVGQLPNKELFKSVPATPRDRVLLALGGRAGCHPYKTEGHCSLQHGF